MEAWERIYTIMNEEGLNKNSLSRRMGLQNNVTITKIINDHRNPQETTLEKVADAFPQYSRRWVLYGEEPKLAVDSQKGANLPENPSPLIDVGEGQNKLLEALNKALDQNAKLIEQLSSLVESNERNSKSIERLINILQKSDESKQVI